MSVRYEVDREKGWVRLTSWGASGFEEQLPIFEEILAERPPMPLRVLDDRRRISKFGKATDARRGARHAHDLVDVLRGARVAFVVSQAASFGMIRMFQILTEELPFELQVFYSLEEAEAWLLVE